MTRVFYQITENHPADKMFDLVNNIDVYPEFVPGCVNAKILDNKDNQIRACLEVEKLGFRKRFTTLNTLTPSSSIEMSLIDGPFRTLHGIWTFTPLSETSCRISFDLTFEFKNRILDLTFTPIFKELMENMVKAFSNRARLVYNQHRN